MTTRRSCALLCCFVTLLFASFAAEAADSRFDLGLRAVMLGMNDEPANDAPGYGLSGRYRLGGNWSVGLALESLEFDFERPYRLLGLAANPSAGEGEIDSSTQSTMLSAWVERAYPSRSGRFEWFWTAGVGAAAVEADDVVGPLADGGSYHITTDAGTELVLVGTGGLRRFMGQHWALEGALRVEHHLADWTVRDRVSGLEATLGSYTGWGGQLGVSFRF